MEKSTVRKPSLWATVRYFAFSYDPKKFKNAPSIVTYIPGGRLGNMISAFLTLLWVHLDTGKKKINLLMLNYLRYCERLACRIGRVLRKAVAQNSVTLFWKHGRHPCFGGYFLWLETVSLREVRGWCRTSGQVWKMEKRQSRADLHWQVQLYATRNPRWQALLQKVSQRSYKSAHV